MSSITEQREETRAVLRDIGLDDDDVASVRDSDLDNLAAAGYDQHGRLKAATFEDLKGAGLTPADARFIVSTRDGGSGGGGKAATKKASSGGQRLLSVAVGGPLLLLVLVLDRGVGKFDEAVQCMKAFIARNNPHLAGTNNKAIRGLGFVGSIGVGAAAVVGACFKRLNVRPGRPRVLRQMNPKLGSTGSEQGPEQRPNLAPAPPAMSDFAA